MNTRAISVELAELTLPDFGLPTVEPGVPPETYEARIAETRRWAADAGYDALLVYADREHFANLAYLTRYDPRFEEVLPFSNMPAYLPPFWLSTRLALRAWST
jgi:hypothetical protein